MNSQFNKYLMRLFAFLILLPPVYPQATGILEGRIINGTDRSITAAGIEVDVISLAGGMDVIKTIKTGVSGEFRVDGVSTAGPLMVRSNYKSAGYHKQVMFNNAGRARVEIEVFETTTSMKDIRVEKARMFFGLTKGRLQYFETVSFNNRTKPPRTFMSPGGNFRFSKPAGILEMPQLGITAPGATMPLLQTPLESPDGQSYYSLYPLRPGITAFEVQMNLPYESRNFTLKKKFYQDIDSLDIGVQPRDLAISGQGIKKIQSDPQEDFDVYSAPSVKSGSEMVLTFSGGTPIPEPETAESINESTVSVMPTEVGRDTPIIGAGLLIVFSGVLFYASKRMAKKPAEALNLSNRELRQRREELLNSIAGLDQQYENKSLEQKEYMQRRELAKRELQQIFQSLQKD